MSIQINSNKIKSIILASFAILILFGTYHAAFTVIAFLLMCFCTVFFDRETSFLQIIFVMPMATIFKVAPGTQSFFTMIMLLYVIVNCVLSKKAAILIVAFSVYILIGQFLCEGIVIFKTIKLICNCLFLASVLSRENRIAHKKIFYSFIAGSLVASLFGMIDSSVFKIKNYVAVENVGGIEFIGLTRFKGLYGDPNYYTVGIIICLCMIVVMYHRKDIQTSFAALLSAPFAYFLILTYSKSAIIAVFFPLIFLLYSLLTQKKKMAFLCIVFFAVVLIILALNGKIEMLNVVIARFGASETADGTDLNNLTTGRFDLWVLYAKALLENPFSMFWGRGINASILDDHAAHNTYIDMLYYLGVLGTALFFAFLCLVLKENARKKIKRNLLNYSALLSVLFLYFGLSELFYFDMPFHILFVFMILNLPMTVDKSFSENNRKIKAPHSMIGDLK